MVGAFHFAGWACSNLATCGFKISGKYQSRLTTNSMDGYAGPAGNNVLPLSTVFPLHIGRKPGGRKPGVNRGTDGKFTLQLIDRRDDEGLPKKYFI
jgi:hypothetical protein